MEGADPFGIGPVSRRILTLLQSWPCQKHVVFALPLPPHPAHVKSVEYKPDDEGRFRTRPKAITSGLPITPKLSADLISNEAGVDG